jgi:hypothetical protein
LEKRETNFGWILISDLEDKSFTAKRFGSRETLDSSPSLHINFLKLPRIKSIHRSGDQIQFSFQTSPGQAYTIQYKENLAPGDWTTLTEFPNQTAVVELTVTDLLSAALPSRFYRIVSF